MRLVQFRTVQNQRAVARVEGDQLMVLEGITYIAELAKDAISAGRNLAQTVYAATSSETVN